MQDGRGRCGHCHRYQPAGVLCALPAVSDAGGGRLPRDGKGSARAQKDGGPHHQGGPAHRYPEHGHLPFQCAGAGQRQRLWCRCHGRLCRLYEGGWLQHSACAELQHGGHHLCGPELWCGQDRPCQKGHLCHPGHVHRLHHPDRHPAARLPGFHHAPVHRR